MYVRIARMGNAEASFQQALLTNKAGRPVTLCRRSNRDAGALGITACSWLIRKERRRSLCNMQSFALLPRTIPSWMAIRCKGNGCQQESSSRQHCNPRASSSSIVKRLTINTGLPGSEKPLATVRKPRSLWPWTGRGDPLCSVSEAI